jgi:septum formation inhibitor MinC
MRNRFLKFYPSISLCALIAAPIPFILVALTVFFNTEKLDIITERMELLSQKHARLKVEEIKEKTFLDQIKLADRFYIDKQLESLCFQENEINKLKVQIENQVENEVDNKRLIFLEKSNRLRFIEENFRSSELVQEVEEKQEKSIEINEDDLKKLLVLIENVPIDSYTQPQNPPQLLVKHLHLSKKPTSLYQSVFQLDMQLIKREGAQR